jgi:hypothetical protein
VIGLGHVLLARERLHVAVIEALSLLLWIREVETGTGPFVIHPIIKIGF